MQRFDVAIVGAGPSGSAAAITLARCGYAVTILDKERFPRAKLCGDFINPSNWPTLHQLGIDQEISSAARERITFFRITSHFGAEALVPMGTTHDTYGVSLERATLDAILLTRAKQQGAVALEQCKVGSLQRVRSGWSITADSADGPVELNASVVIGADGRNSRVAHHQGLPGAAPKGSGSAVGFQFLLQSKYSISGRIEIHLFPGGYVGLLELQKNLLNFCFSVEKKVLDRCGSLDSVLDSVVQENRNLKTLLRSSERVGSVRSVYPVYFASRRSYADGLLLTGDAARVSEPVTGEGVYFALRSGVIAGEVLHGAFQSHDLSAHNLRAYAVVCNREFRLRRSLNKAIRYAIYRPRLLTPLIQFSQKRRHLLDLLVHALCFPNPSPSAIPSYGSEPPRRRPIGEGEVNARL